MILIIDDDIGIRTSLTMMLRRAGYEPHAVASPREAIAIVKQQKPRLILMDMNYSLTQAITAAAFAQTGKTTVAQNLMPVVTDGSPHPII